jgi:hypothetical protein
MNIKSAKLWILGSSCLLVAAQSQLLATSIPVDNFGNYSGSFDTVVLGNSFGQNNGWTVTAGNIALVSPSIDQIGQYWQSPDGNNTVDMDGNAPGSIETQINVPYAGTVTINFDLSGNPDGGNPAKTLVVGLGSLSSPNFIYTTGSNSHSDMEYASESVSFNVASGGSYFLSFTSLDAYPSPYGPVVGAVTANIPDGGFTVAMLGLALTGLAACKRLVGGKAS